jgi:tetratricopeptide (TPR) repeat protein
VRITTLNPEQAKFNYRLVSALILMAVLQLTGRSAFAWADYYAPRTENGEISTFNNVTNYHLGPGREELAKTRFEAALQHAEFVLRYFPNHPQALSLLSEICLRSAIPKCTATAEGWFKNAIAINPDAAPTYVLQALFLHRKQRLNEAVDAYRRAIELAPESLNAHYNLGLAYMDLKQFDLANVEAQKSYQLGASLQGLRTRLEKAGKWNPNIKLPDSNTSSASEAKPDDQLAPQIKTPDESPVTK